jgi:hypothetical protein
MGVECHLTHRPTSNWALALLSDTLAIVRFFTRAGPGAGHMRIACIPGHTERTLIGRR